MMSGGETVNCFECGACMQNFVETHHFTESGHSCVYLEHMAISRCPKCGYEEYTLPKAEKVHRVIATAITLRPARWSGEQFTGESAASYPIYVDLRTFQFSFVSPHAC